MNRVVRSAGALVLLLALAVGVPVALVVLAGWPLPSKVPDVGNVLTMVRQNNIQADFVIKTVALVVWFAWVQLTVAVVWETAVNVPRLLSGRRQRRVPLVAPPVANGVAKLFSLILTTGLLSTVVAQPAIALTTSAVDLTPDTSSLSSRTAIETSTSASASEAVAAPDAIQIASVWVSQGDDSLWDIAEQALGDGSEVSVVLQMNPDLDASQTLTAGTEIRLPADATVPASRTRTADLDPSEPARTPAGPIVERNAPTAVDRYVVQSNDGMWNVAEALLGDGSRHGELHDLLVGREVAPGVVFTADTSVIHEGWVFTLDPAASAEAAPGEPAEVETHTVVVGDTLSGIAERELGDADAWPELYEANAGRQMGDGRTFDDPNLILPGWQIEVPADAPPDDRGAADTTDPSDTSDPASPDDDEVPASTPVPGTAPSAPASPAAPSTPGSTAAPSAPSTPVSPAAPSAPAIPATPSAPAVPVTSTTVAPLGDASGTDIDDDRPGRPGAPAPIRIEHAALLAAGVLALVGVRRRQRLRAATPRARVPAPPPNIVATERRLRTVDAGERAMRVDVAIRAAAHELVDVDAQIGTVLVDHDGGVEIRLTGPAELQSPWVGVTTDLQSWEFPAASPIELLSESARRVGTPCVALVQLGLADGRDVLIDVEACGTVAIDAPARQATDVLVALASGLATSPYAEIAHLVSVAVPETAVVGHRNAHRAASPGHAFELATSMVGTTATTDRSTFSLRSLRTGGEMWEPVVILIDDLEGLPRDLPATLPQPGHGIGLIVSTPNSELRTAGAHLIGAESGWSFAAFGTSIDITPVGMDAVDLAAVSDLVDDASAPLDIDDEITWAADDAAAVRAHAEARGDDTGDIDSDPADDHSAVDGETSTVDQPPAAAPDDDRFTVFEPTDHQIVVRLLGGVDVVSHDDRPGVFERSKTVELIAWLATHRASSTRAAARTALWELDVRDATFANVVSEARRALARLVTPPGDDEWVARTLTEQLPLHTGVVTDADLIEERLAAARLQPPAQAIETLTPAAEMIRDIPFAGTSYLWPDAEGITSNLVLLATGVATELAGHALSLGDTDLVFWATGQGLKVLPGHEELIGLRMQAHARAGDLAGVRQEWESYERVIVADAWSDGEPAPKLLALRHELLTSPT